MDSFDVDPMTPEEAAEIKRRRAAISRRVRKEVLAEFGIDKLPKQGERALVTGAQGTGKSTTCAEAIAGLAAQDFSIWWLVPNLEKADEQAGEYSARRQAQSLRGRVVRGRGAPDPSVKYAEAMCPRHEVVNRAARMGVNVQEAICDDGCSLRTTCGFQRQRTALHDDPVGLFFMASDYLWLPCPAPKADLVIVDESVINKAIENVSFDPSRIVADDLWAGGEIGEVMNRRIVATRVRDAITEHPTRELAFLRDNDISEDALRANIQHLAQRDDVLPDVNGRMRDSTIATLLDAIEAREIAKIMKLFRQVRREFPQPRTRLNSVWYEPESLVKVDGETERAPRIFASAVRVPRLDQEIPVLALDGTGSIDLNRKIFGEGMTHECFPAPRDAEVWQVASKTFSRQSITGVDRRGTLISKQKTRESADLRRQVIDLLTMLPGEILLVTYKAAEEALKSDLPPNVLTAHFGALRGLNSYEHCENVVVMGREQPSAQAIERLTRPFTAADAEPFIPIGEYVAQSRGRRMRHGGPNIVSVQVHSDPRCQAVLEQVREAEIAQAIDRVRPVFNRRRIIVLTNVALDLTVDHARNWPELRPGKFVFALARHGVLPLSAGDLCRGFPDLWRFENTAKSDLKRSGLIGCNPQIETLFGICTPFNHTLLKAAYRRQGQRGKPAQALVSSALSEPRAVLESLVGELAEFGVEGETDPPAARTSPPLPPLPPLAAALSAEGHLLASLAPGRRPPDVLGMVRAMKLVALTSEFDAMNRAAA